MEPKELAGMTPEDIKKAVSDRYGAVAADPCATFSFPVGRAFCESVGYQPELLDAMPKGFWESFTGAGNPQAFVDARDGETVLDMGCGAGLDMFLYSRKVGPNGKVYGLDISDEMIEKARANFIAGGATNFEFLLASSDAVPLPDNSVDIVTANGIYNLSPDKDDVMREVYRVLKPGGRTVFAEIVLLQPFEKDDRKTINDWFRCVGGALTKTDFLGRMLSHGFKKAEILWEGRNARTKNALAVCAVIRGEK